LYLAFLKFKEINLNREEKKEIIILLINLENSKFNICEQIMFGKKYDIMTEKFQLFPPNCASIKSHDCLHQRYRRFRATPTESINSAEVGEACQSGI